MHPGRRLALLVCGCFALVLAALLPGYVYPRLAVLPGDPGQAQVQRGSGATVLVPDLDAPAGARVVRDVDVEVTTFVSEAPVDRPDGTVVWDLSTETSVGGHGLLDARVERVSLDARNAEPVNCCGDRLATEHADPGGRPIYHEGLVTFPFDVSRRDYPVWDVQLGRARTARYVGEETVDGVRTYRFQAHTPFEDIGTRELPGGLFDVDAPAVTAVEQYADTRTYWVEPQTGAVVDLHEVLHQRFVHDGREVTAISAELESPSLDADLLADLRQGARMLPWVRWRASAVLVVVALALLAPVAYRSREELIHTR